MAVSSYSVTFLKKEQITKDAYAFYFSKPRSFQFIAGQYLKMKLDIKNPDNGGNSRYFTISSSPTEKELIIITKISKSTFKKTLNNLKTGDKVQIRGPWGEFVLPKKVTQPVVFLSEDIGITPFRSIVKYILDKNLKTPVTLFAAYEDVKDLIEKEFFEEANKTSRITVIYSIPGAITRDLLQKHLDGSKKYVYYSAGPETFVASMKALLAKIAPGSSFTEDFPGY